MKQVKVCYSKRDNIGDLINPLIIEKILGYQVEWANPFDCQVSGIGSGLSRFFMPKKQIFTSVHGAKTYLLGRSIKIPCEIWSAGFITSATGSEVPIRKNLEIASVRGELSKCRIEKIYGKKINASTGDGGLLSSELLNDKIEKKFTLGIIPHDKERGEKEYQILKDKIPNSVLINVRGDAMENLKIISQCECIVSSSLHGLIIADSFGIPNQQLVLTDKLAGDGFKFKDYYSCFSLEQNPINLNQGLDIDIEKVIEEYPVKKESVDKKKQEIKSAFASFLS